MPRFTETIVIDDIFEQFSRASGQFATSEYGGWQASLGFGLIDPDSYKTRPPLIDFITTTYACFLFPRHYIL